MSETYFDRREQREKPIPNCGAVGLVWDAQMQRCERPQQYLSIIENYGGGMSGIGNRGLGICPGLDPMCGVATGASVAGPVGAIVGGVIGAVASLWRLFGGGDDQATTYRPPSNAAQLCVSFNDSRGSENVAYDMSRLGTAIANGNRDVDLYSYYSAFVSGRTDMGASQAAARVIQDAATRNGVSVSRAADLILQVAGVPRIACAGGFLPGPGATSNSGLPGYCPPGTYHPYPIGDPRQDVCEPFPAQTWAAEVARQIEQQRQQQQAQQRARQPTGTRQPSGGQMPQGGAPPGMWLNPATGRYEPIPSCASGQYFDTYTGRCVGGSSSSGLFSGDNSWLWLLLLLAGVLVATSGGDDGYRRAKR